MGRKRKAELYDICCHVVRKDDVASWIPVRQWLNSCISFREAACYQGYDNRRYHTPLHIIVQKSPPLDVVKTIVTNVSETLKIQDVHGCLPIHVACYSKASREVLQLLIQHYPDSLSRPDKSGRLPIHHACIYKASLEVLNLLIETYPDGLKVEDDGNFLPIHLACFYGASLEVISKLLEAYPDGMDAQVIQSEISAILKNRDWVKQRDDNGMIPLHHVYAQNLSIHLTNLLIDAYPEGVDVTDNDGKKPIDYLQQTSDEENSTTFPGPDESNIDVRIEPESEACHIPDDDQLQVDITQTELWQKIESETVEMKGKLMDVSEIKFDVKETKSELAQLKSEMSVMKSDMAQLKTEMRQMNAELKADISDIKNMLSSLISI